MIITDIITTGVYVASLAISFVTLRILVITLKENIELNRKQSELIEFSLKKAAREIRPEFELKTTDDDQDWLLCITCKKNIAHRVTSSINFDISRDSNGNLIYQNHKFEPFYKPGTEIWRAKFPKTEDIPNGFFRLEYMDEDGRKYEQRLFFNVNFDTLNDRPFLVI